MRKLTQKEIDDAPSWAVSYNISELNCGGVLSYHERHYGFTLPLPPTAPSKEFDISINFGKDELLEFIDKIEWFNDEGPHHSGWQSQEFIDFISKLKKAAE